MSGGRLVQHQQNPYSEHPIEVLDGKKLMITSSHHQAQFPFDLPKNDYKIIGWTNGISKFHENGEQEEMNPERECEIVFYKNTKVLGIQGHPEWMFDPKHPTIIYLRGLLNDLLENKITTNEANVA